MKRAGLLSVATAALVFLVVSGPAAADQNVLGTCPDGYTPTPAVLAPDEDKNGDGVICVKAVDGHVNTKDDPNGTKYECNGFPTPPAECAGVDSLLIRDDVPQAA